MIYTLPIESSLIRDITENDIIDMTNLNFTSASNPQRMALLFIRNTGVYAKFMFDNCSFIEKESYLLLYLTGKRINVNIAILATTWVNILVHNKLETKLPSILSYEEIEIFIEKHHDVIDEFYRFLVSIPLCSMNFYRDKDNNPKIDISEFEKSDFTGFNAFTLIKIFNYKEMVILPQLIEGIKPIFYSKYFESKSDRTNNIYPGFINDLMNKFPYSELLNILMSNNQNMVNGFICGFENILNIKK